MPPSLDDRTHIDDPAFDAVAAKLNAIVAGWGGTGGGRGAIGHHRHEGTGESTQWISHQTYSWTIPFNGQIMLLAAELQEHRKSKQRRVQLTGKRKEPKSSASANSYRITWQSDSATDGSTEIRPQNLSLKPAISERCRELGIAATTRSISLPATDASTLLADLFIILTIIEDEKATKPIRTPIDRSALLQHYCHPALWSGVETSIRAKYGFGGEGDEHKALKAFITHHPERLGLGPATHATPEYTFITGNRVDILVSLVDGREAVVEIETDIALPGVHQALLYRTLRAVQRNESLASPAIIPVLVAHSVDTFSRICAERYGVHVVTISRSEVRCEAPVPGPAGRERKAPDVEGIRNESG